MLDNAEMPPSGAPINQGEGGGLASPDNAKTLFSGGPIDRGGGGGSASRDVASINHNNSKPKVNLIISQDNSGLQKARPSNSKPKPSVKPPNYPFSKLELSPNSSPKPERPTQTKRFVISMGKPDPKS